MRFAAMLALGLMLTGAAQAQVTDQTRAANAQMSQTLPWADREDEDFASRGFIAQWDQPQIRAADGHVVWDFNAYNFLTPDVPETVNPSLWRQARLLARAGLFQVSDRVYQVRGFDVSNMTIVVGDTGLIIIDPLTSTEVASAALALARRTIGDRPVRAVIYTHSHVDHFGGYPAFGQLLGGLQGFQHRGAPADQGDVVAFAQGEGRAQRQGFAIVSDWFFQQPVQPGGL